MIHNPQTIQKMSALGLNGMVSAYENQQNQPEAKKLNFDERLNMLIDAEISSRDTRRVTRLLKSAKLRYADACVEEVIYNKNRNIERIQFKSVD